MLDVVIISDAKNLELHKTTCNAIDSLKKSEDIPIQVIVVESNHSIKYDDAITAHPTTPFNYNKYLNIGMSFGSNEWVALCNNDLIFHKNWFSEILKAKEDFGFIESFSPWNSFENWHDIRIKEKQNVYLGYGIGYQLCGWCIVAKRTLFDTIKLNEEVTFWCSDNIYADDLSAKGIHHALVRNSIVDHITSKTLFTLPNEKIKELTEDQGVVYANWCRDNHQK